MSELDEYEDDVEPVPLVERLRCSLPTTARGGGGGGGGACPYTSLSGGGGGGGGGGVPIDDRDDIRRWDATVCGLGTMVMFGMIMLLGYYFCCC